MRPLFFVWVLSALVLVVLPGTAFAECSFIQWEESDFPASAHKATYITLDDDYGGYRCNNMGYWYYPYGEGKRHISVNFRSFQAEEGRDAWVSYLRSDYAESYTYVGRVAELEDTVLEEVHAYRRVFAGCAPTDDFCNSNLGEEGYALVGKYKGNTSIDIYTSFNYYEPLVIPDGIHHDLYREVKTLIDGKCPSYRLEPFEASLQVGETTQFVLKDGSGAAVNNADIRWAVINENSISPHVTAKNADIGAVSAAGLFNATGIGTCVVSATLADETRVEASVSVRCPDGSGDLGRLKELYGQRIPEGPFHGDVAAGKIGLPLRLMNPGYANNLLAITDARYGNFTCGACQDQVLKFLHKIQADPAECSILNGLEFGPVQGSYGGHHAVVIYPKGGDWKSQGTVFDPWYRQKPEFFDVGVWEQVFHPLAGDTSAGYRLEYPTTRDPSDFDTDVWRTSEALVQDLLDVVGIVDCPVNLLFRDDRGRTSGVDGDGAMHFDIPDTFFMRLPDGEGGYEWYFRLSGQVEHYAMEVAGTADGVFELVTASGDTGVSYAYPSQPIGSGQTASAEISGSDPGPSVTLPGGTPVTPSSASLPDSCWLVDADLGIFVPRAEFAGRYYTFRLNYSQGIVWILDAASFGETGSGAAVPVDGDLSMRFSCAEYAGVRYAFTLRWKGGLDWELDVSTLTVQ